MIQISPEGMKLSEEIGHEVDVRMAQIAERLKTENEILRAEYARVDNERLRLVEEVAELRQLLSGGAVPELQAQVRDARRVIKGMIVAVVAPLSKWRKGKAVIDANLPLLDAAALEAQLLGEGGPGAN